MFSAKPLPFEATALAAKCGISKETVDFHYGKHHLGYVTRLNAMATAAPTAYQGWTVESLSSNPGKHGTVEYNMAAQIWNHDFFWASLSPLGGGEPSEAVHATLTAQLKKDFGSVKQFVDAFTREATGHFGSGWAWLVFDRTTRRLRVLSTHDAVCPLSLEGGFGRLAPILVCDVWEHAYYIDFRNDRAAFVNAFWKAVNWSFAEANVRSAIASPAVAPSKSKL